MLAQDGELVSHRLRTPVDVAHVGVLGDEFERAALAAATDHDGRAAGTQRTRDIARSVDPVVLAVERRLFLPKHRPADLHCFFEPVQSFTV